MPFLYFGKNDTTMTEKLSQYPLMLIAKDKNRKEKVAMI